MTPVPLPLRLKYPGVPVVAVESRGVRIGDGPPRADLLLALWDGLMHAIALGEVTLPVRPKDADRRQAEAAAALQVHLRGR